MTFLDPKTGTLVFFLLVSVYVSAWLLRSWKMSRIRRAWQAEGKVRDTRWYGVAAAFLLLAGAAFQPVETIEHVETEYCASAEVGIAIDNSVSFIARPSLQEQARYVRAANVALRLRQEHGCAKWGLSSFSDNLAPRFFPGGSSERLTVGLREVIWIGDPPGRTQCALPGCLTTDLPQVINQLVTTRYFSDDPDVESRILIVLTDGETKKAIPTNLPKQILEHDIDIVLIHISDPDDRVFMEDGSKNPYYQPVPDSRERLEHIAGRLPNTVAFDEDEVSAATDYIGALLGDTTERGKELRTETPVFFAPWLMLLSLATLLLSIGRTTLQLIVQRVSKRS